jgi:hypothetical protein
MLHYVDWHCIITAKFSGCTRAYKLHELGSEMYVIVNALKNHNIGWFILVLVVNICYQFSLNDM